MRHLDVDARNIKLATAYSPRYNTSQLPDAAHLAHQRAPAIALASVLPLLATSTGKPRVKSEVEPEPRSFQFCLTVKMRQNRDVHLLENVLVAADLAKGVLPPPGDEAALPGEVLERVGKTDRRDVGIALEVHMAVQFDESNVIVEVARVVLGMDVDGQNVHLDIWVELDIIVDIPLPEPDAELLWAVPLDTVGGGEKAAAIYQRSATDINVVILLLFKYRNLPGIFTKLCISFSEVCQRSVNPSVDSMCIPATALSESAELVPSQSLTEGIWSAKKLVSNIPNMIIVGGERGEFRLLGELSDAIVGVDSAADVPRAGAATGGRAETLRPKWPVVVTLGSRSS